MTRKIYIFTRQLAEINICELVVCVLSELIKGCDNKMKALEWGVNKRTGVSAFTIIYYI